MNYKRAFEIINKKEICDVYYNNEPVWIQNLENDIAKVGFMNFKDERDVKIEDLYE